MKTMKFLLPAAVLLAGLGLNLTPVEAKPEYTKKEKKSCNTCHVKPAVKDLNKTGECYKEKKTLEGCIEKK